MVYIRGLTTNRTFNQVDERFCLKLGDEIKERAKSKPDLTVCDIACGPLATALADLTAYHPQLRGIGLDYQLKDYEDARLKLVKGDLFSIPFESVADVTYCAFVLADVDTIAFSCAEHLKKTAQAVFQIAKTLLPNGIAFVDEGVYSTGQCFLDDLIGELESQNPGYSKRFQTTNDQDLGLLGNYLIIRRNDSS